MAARIKGITVEIGGNATGLDKALGDVNAKSRNLQKELKEVEQLLKLDPKNTELLAQKQKLLAEAIKTSAEKLDTLKSAESQVQEQFEKGEIKEEQYRNFQREIVKAENSLKSFENQAKEMESSLSKAFENVGKAAQKVSEKTEELAEKTKKVSLVAGGVVVALGGMAVKAGQAADDINTLAAQTGLSTEQIQKFQYAADIIDVDLNTLTGSMAKLIKNMATASKGTGDASTAFEALGISVTDSNGELRNNQDVFNEAIAALGEMENATQRDAYAMQIFGKSAQDLNPLILGGADALQQLGDDAEAAGLILSQDALDAANEFNDGIDVLKAKATATFAKVGSTIGAQLVPMMEKLVDKVSDILAWFGKLDGDTAQLIITIALLVAGLSPALKLISAITTAVKLLSTAMAFLAANPIGAIITVIALLVIAFITLWTKCEGFRNFFIAIWEAIKTAASVVADFFVMLFTETIPNALSAVVNFFVNAWEGIKAAFSAVGEFFIGIFAAAWEGVQAVWNAVIGFFTGIWNGITSVFAAVGTWFKDIFTGAWEGIKNVFSAVGDFFGGIWDIIKSKFTSIGSSIGNAIGDAFKTVVNAVINFAESTINGFIKAINVAISVINAIPGVEITKLSLIDIPALAKGGILSNGQAIVAEAGPELISMSNGKTTVTPLSSSAKNSAVSSGKSINFTQNNYSPKALSRSEIYRQGKNALSLVALGVK